LDIRRLASIYIDIPAIRPGTVGAYTFAAVSALAATVVRVAVDPYVVGTQYLVFHSAVMITTLSSGLVAGLLCALLSFAAVVLFVRPLDYVGLSLFIVVLLLDVLVPAAMRFAVERYRELSRTLEWRIEDRTAEVVQRNRELDEKNRQLRQANDELIAVYEQGLFASHLNTEGKIVHANRACVEDLGFARADIIGKLFWEAAWWHMPEAQEWIRKAFERAAAGTPFRGEVSYVLKNGTERVTDISFVPIKDEAGHVTSVFVPGTDVTDRARQYRATFENAGVGIAHLSRDGKWIRVNQTFARIVGYPPEELVSKSVQDITHPDDLEFSLAQIERLRSGKADSYEIEKRYVRKDGTPVWVHITSASRH
jgi:two-component system, NarL family, sensor histidine kinase UhpB